MDLQSIASIISAIAALGAVLMSWHNSKKIQSVHVDINSRMSELLAATRLSAHADGFEQGRQSNLD